MTIMGPSSAIILIPARYHSQRFPGKPLAQLKGKSVVQRVHENMAQSGYPAAVVTDDARIERHLQEVGAQVVRVDDEVASGTERIALAYQRHFQSTELQFVVNVQGDEPLLPGAWVAWLVNFHRERSFDVTTLVRAAHGEESFASRDIVKVALGEGGVARIFPEILWGMPRSGGSILEFTVIGLRHSSNFVHGLFQSESARKISSSCVEWMEGSPMGPWRSRGPLW